LEQIKVTGEEDWQVIVISKHKPQNWHKLNLRRVFSGSYRVFCERAEQIWDKKKGWNSYTAEVNWIHSNLLVQGMLLAEWIAPDAIWLQWLQKEQTPQNTPCKMVVTKQMSVSVVPAKPKSKAWQEDEWQS
jgi:hypothetical protein